VRGYFEDEYDADMDECVSDIEDQQDDLGRNLDDIPDCDFDEDEAQDCLDELRTDDCGEFWEDYVRGESRHCSDVWTCFADWEF
jgi:hypothetical protein